MSNFKSSLINDLAIARLGQPGGFAKLDENGLVTLDQLPAGSAGGSLSWVEGTRATNPMNPFASIPDKLDGNGNPYVWRFSNSGPVSLDGSTVISVTTQDRIWYHISSDTWFHEKQPPLYQGADAYQVGTTGTIPIAQQGQQNYILKGDGNWGGVWNNLNASGGPIADGKYLVDATNAITLTLDEAIGEVRLFDVKGLSATNNITIGTNAQTFTDLSGVAQAGPYVINTNNEDITFVNSNATNAFTVVKTISVSPAGQPLTYGRVNASINLVSKAFSPTGVGSTIDFTATVYSSGMTFSGTSGITPSVAGRYRASYYLNLGSDVTAFNATVKVVQGGVSLGDVYINQHNNTGSVNQTAGFIDVNVAAGTPVFLHYQPDSAEAIEFDQGTYFQLSQLPTAVAPVVNIVAEYGEQVLGSNITVPTTSTSPTVATDILSFTLPSAGTWDVDFIVRGATFAVNTSGGNGMVAVLTDNSNNVIPNTELKVGRESFASVDALTLDLQFSATGKAQIVTTGATTYKVRGYHDGSGGFTGSWTAQSDNNGRTKVSWNKIAGQLPAIMPTIVSGGLAFGNGTALVQDSTNLFYDDTNNRLGIGTNAPTAKTQIVSTATANPTGEPLLKLSSNYGGGLLPGAGGSLIFTDEVNTNVGEIRSLTQGPNNVELSFSTFAGGVLGEKLRINPIGNLGIGVTNPLNNLHIGTASIANTGGIRLPITSASANQTGGAIGVDANGDIVKIASGGSSTTYIYASISSQITIGSLSAQNIPFNEVGASNGLSLNGSGEFLLQGGVTYELDASCPWQVNSGIAMNGNVVYSWVDSSNTLLGTTGNVGISSFGSNGGSTPGNGVSQNAKLIYTPPFTQLVKVRITAGNMGGASNIALYQRGVGYPTPYVTIRSI